MVELCFCCGEPTVMDVMLSEYVCSVCGKAVMIDDEDFELHNDEDNEVDQ